MNAEAVIPSSILTYFIGSSFLKKGNCPDAFVRQFPSYFILYIEFCVPFFRLTYCFLASKSFLICVVEISGVRGR